MIHRPRHARSRFSSRATKLTAAALALLVVAAIAVAAMLLRANVSGSGNIQSPANIRFTAVSVVGSTGQVTPQATLNGDNSVTLNLNDALPGATVDVDFQVQKMGSQSGSATVSEFRYSTVTDEQILQGQGATIAASPNSTLVRVRLTIPANAPAGPFTAQADAGLYADFA